MLWTNSLIHLYGYITQQNSTTNNVENNTTQNGGRSAVKSLVYGMLLVLIVVKVFKKCSNQRIGPDNTHHGRQNVPIKAINKRVKHKCVDTTHADIEIVQRARKHTDVYLG
jgi:hypothetical protein